MYQDMMGKELEITAEEELHDKMKSSFNINVMCMSKLGVSKTNL